MAKFRLLESDLRNFAWIFLVFVLNFLVGGRLSWEFQTGYWKYFRVFFHPHG